MTSILLNPSILFCAVWGSTLFFYSLKYSELLTTLEPKTIVLVVGSCVAALVGWVVSRAFAHVFWVNPVRARESWSQATRERLSKNLRWIFSAWLALVIFEFISFGNLPFLSLLGIGPSVLYTEYGFSGLHGLLNAVQLVMFDMALIFYIRTGQSKYILYAAVLIGWSVLMVTRAIIMASIIQGVFIGFIFSASFRKRFVFLGSTLVLIVILLFGVLGDLRTSDGTAIRELGQQADSYPDFLPAGFFWVYIYVTTPLNNINANINSISGLGFPYYSILPLLPNVVRGLLAIEDLDVSLVEESLNVSSFFRQFIFDFGVYGTIFVVGVMHLAFNIAMARSKRNELWSLVLVVILFSTVISVFVNAYTAIIYLMQLIVFRAVYWKAMAKRPVARAKVPRLAAPSGV